MPVTAPRIIKYRERQKAKGMRRINCALTQDGDAALRTLQALSPEVPMGEIISSALIRLALAQVEKRARE